MYDINEFKGIEFTKNKKESFEKTYEDFFIEEQKVSRYDMLNELKSFNATEKALRAINLIGNNTSIRKMELQINGSCDSGGLDYTRFYDKHDNQLSLDWELEEWCYCFNTKEHWDEKQYNPSLHNSLLPKRIQEKYGINDVNLVSWENFSAWLESELLNKDIYLLDTNRIPSYITKNDKKNNYRLEYTLIVPEGNKSAFSNEFGGSFCYGNSSKQLNYWNFLFGKMPTMGFYPKEEHPFSVIESAAYSLLGQLQPGWEINEGSQNIVTFNWISKGFSTDTKNEIFEANIQSNMEVNVMNQHIKERAINLNNDDIKEMDNTINRLMNRRKTKMINLSTKQGTETLYRIVKKSKELLKENK